MLDLLALGKLRQFVIWYLLAHWNLIETVPLALILLYLFERSAADPMHVHVLGALLFVARLGPDGLALHGRRVEPNARRRQGIAGV